jgi:hypothetical protein
MGTKKGQIGNTISYAPAPAYNMVSTYIPTLKGKIGDEWDKQLKPQNSIGYTILSNSMY